MQHKKSQHNESLRKSFENVIIFKERLMNIWKTPLRLKHTINSAKNKGIELTPKLSMDMVSLPLKLLFEAHSHQFLTQNSRE
jgi:hypothetical protein